jgi:hypothetical protein
MSFGMRRALVWAASAFSLATAQAQEILPEIVAQAQRPAPPRVAPTSAKPSSPVASANSKLDEARDGLSPRFGASSFDLNRAAIESLPQGINTPIQKVLIQAPGVSQDSAAAGNGGKLTARFDFVNVFDSVYLIRDGSGIGVFAPQYGPCRGFFVGLSKKFG